jgi:hypothetical protein
MHIFELQQRRRRREVLDELLISDMQQSVPGKTHMRRVF